MVLGRTTEVCGALWISSHAFVVGAVLYGDLQLSTPLIFSEYLGEKTLGSVSLANIAVVILTKHGIFVPVEPRELASTTVPRQGCMNDQNFH